MGISKEGHDRASEISWIIGLKEVLPGNEWKTLCADRGRHDRLPHCERLEDLESCSATYSQRHNVHRGLSDERAHVFDGPGHVNAGLCSLLTQPRRWVPSHDR